MWEISREENLQVSESLRWRHLWGEEVETLLFHTVQASSDVISPACIDVRLVYGLELEIQTHALLNIWFSAHVAGGSNIHLSAK